MEEAKRAGLVKQSTPWVTFPRDMLYARALSRLARQLFPDIIGNCYVEGEIALDPNIKESPISENDRQEEKIETINVTLEDIKSNKISEEEYKDLSFYLDQLPDYKASIIEFLDRKGIDNIWEMPKEAYDKILERAKEKVKEQDEKLNEI